MKTMRLWPALLLLLAGHWSAPTASAIEAITPVCANAGDASFQLFVLAKTGDLDSSDRPLWVPTSPAGSTYLGGMADDFAAGVALDDAGNVYVSGATSSPDFPLTNAIQDELGGSRDAFAAKLQADGSTLLYSTYLGGAGDDSAADIAIDSNGAAVVVGLTGSADFPTMNPEQAALGNPSGADFDAFAARIAVDGTALEYSTYLGGTGADAALAVHAGQNGNIFLVGSTRSGDYPTLDPLQNASGGATDGFVTQLGPAGEITYSTYFGGSGDDAVLGVSAAADGSAYIQAMTKSPDAPATLGGYQSTKSGAADSLIAKIIPGYGSHDHRGIRREF